MKGSFIKNLRRAFAVGVLLLVSSSIASYVAIRESYKRADLVHRTEVVRSKLEALLSLLKDAETGVRGYLITKDVGILEPYYGSYQNTLHVFNVLKSLTRDDQQQQASLTKLNTIIRQRYAQLDEQITLQKTKYQNDNNRIKEGKSTMDKIRAEVVLMQQRQSSLYDRRERIWQTYRTLSPLLIIIIAITGTLMAHYFCSNLKTAYFRNAQLQRILQQEKIDTDRRIKIIQNIANQISQGNYNLRLEEKESGVLGSLSLSLNKMASSLEYSFDALKQLMTKKDDFVSIAAHELKTPLTSIKAYLQFMSRIQIEDDEGRKIYPFVSKANMQVNKLSDIIKDLLDVARINEGQLGLQTSEFSIRDAIIDVTETMFSAAKTHEVFIEADPDIVVRADRFRIEQVLINLISNAAKYSPENSCIIVEAKRDEDMAAISVQDFGIGIPSHQVPYVFERYFRVEQNSQKFGGMGLGLYISKGIVERHGGRMNMVSSLGAGTTISFTLPVCVNDLASVPESRTSA